jgi:hypothetical protein
LYFPKFRKKNISEYLVFFPIQGDGRSSSPENDYVDIEGDRHIDRHIGAPSTSLQKAPPIIPALPEVKRSRGRPRKLNTTVEDGKYTKDCMFLIHFSFKEINKQKKTLNLLPLAVFPKFILPYFRISKQILFNWHAVLMT